MTGEVTGILPVMGWWYVNISVSDSWSTTWQNYTLYALNTAPVITTTPDTTCYTGDPYYYDANATDLNGDTIVWDATEKPVWLVVDPSNGQCTGIPVIDGNYDVKLRAFDGISYDWQNWTIVVTTYVPPAPETPPDDEPDYGAPFYARFTYWVKGLTIVVEDASIGDIERWQWSFGDGLGSQGTQVSHRYDHAGTYIVTLTIIGPDGQKSTVQVEVTVVDDPDWYIEKGKVGWIIGTPLGEIPWGAAISFVSGGIILFASLIGRKLPLLKIRTWRIIGLVLLIVGGAFYLA